MRKYVLTLAVLATVPFSGLAMAGEPDPTNTVLAAGAVQLSDEEMDNVSAAGKADAPGQLMRTQLLQVQVSTECTKPGNSCNAPGRLKSLQAHTLGVAHGASSFAPGHSE
jgi:hypothetical protein